jgi:hypothetical protein
MEALLIFLAIIAIQMIAAHFVKEKKETAVKTIKKQLALPTQTYKQNHEEFSLNSHKNRDLQDNRRNRDLRNNSQPEEEEDDKLAPQQTVPQKNNFQFNINEPAQGILWTAILHEPRYRVKWKRK